MKFDGIVAKMAEQVKKEKKRIVLPETEDVRILKAAAIVANGDYADIILIGNEQEIMEKCNKVYCCPEEFGTMNEKNRILAEYAREKGILSEREKEYGI